MLSGTGPIHLELHPMKINPLEEEAQRSMGKVTGHLAGCDVDHELCALASGVDVRGIMITVVHEDYNTTEATDDRHLATAWSGYS